MNRNKKTNNTITPKYSNLHQTPLFLMFFAISYFGQLQKVLAGADLHNPFLNISQIKKNITADTTAPGIVLIDLEEDGRRQRNHSQEDSQSVQEINDANLESVLQSTIENYFILGQINQDSLSLLRDNDPERYKRLFEKVLCEAYMSLFQTRLIESGYESIYSYDIFLKHIHQLNISKVSSEEEQTIISYIKTKITSLEESLGLFQYSESYNNMPIKSIDQFNEYTQSLIKSIYSDVSRAKQELGVANQNMPFIQQYVEKFMTEQETALYQNKIKEVTSFYMKYRGVEIATEQGLSWMIIGDMEGLNVQEEKRYQETMRDLKALLEHSRDDIREQAKQGLYEAMFNQYSYSLKQFYKKAYIQPNLPYPSSYFTQLLTLPAIETKDIISLNPKLPSTIAYVIFQDIINNLKIDIKSQHKLLDDQEKLNLCIKEILRDQNLETYFNKYIRPAHQEEIFTKLVTNLILAAK